MKLFSSKKRVAAIGAVTAASLVGGGVAYAYWTAGGTGTGSASTSAGTADLTISQTSTLTAMYPGDVAQDLDVTVTNNATNPAYVASLGAYITTDAAGCDGTNFLINGASDGTDTTPTGLNWSPVELDATGGAADAADSLNNTVQFNNLPTTNQDACKGAAVTINYVAN